jgi:uncharacterized coiled-coil DUF342 family protein
LLHELAKASATSYQQVKIAAMTHKLADLAREVAALRSENAAGKARNDRLQESSRAMEQGQPPAS